MSSPATAVRERELSSGLSAPYAAIVRWLPLIFGALALLVYGLWYWNPAYRHDEYLVAVARTRLSWSELLRVITTADPGAGPLYLLMKPWTSISSDPAWTRLPSVFAMAVAVGGLVAFVKASLDARTAVFAGLLMLILPVTSRWAQDNRMYAPATACVVLAVGCWWASIRSGSLRWSVAYGAAVVGLGLFHLYGFAVIPALVIGAFWAPGQRRSNLVRTIVPPAIAFLILLPHIYLNYAHPTGSPSNPPASLGSLRAILTANAGPILFVIGALLAIGGSVWTWQFRERRAIVATGLGWVLLPLLLFMIARAVIGMPTLSPRYYVVAIPGVCLLAACGLAALYSLWRPGAVIALVVVVALAIPMQISVRASDAHDPAGRRLVTLLGQPELAGLPIVAAGGNIQVTLDAATYPNSILTPSNADPQPVAVIVAARPSTLAHSNSPYLQPQGPWRPVVQCMPGSEAVLIVAADGAGVPAGDAETLARRLNAAVPRSRCVVAP